MVASALAWRANADHPLPPPYHLPSTDHTLAADAASVTGIVMAGLIVGVLVHHWRTASGSQRRSLAAPWIVAITWAVLAVGVAGAAVLRAPGPVKLALMVTLFAAWAVASAVAYSWRAAEVRLTVALRAQVRRAAAEERRRIQRDVHDGAQQRLFAASILMDLAKQQLERPTGDAFSAAAAVTRAQGQLADAIRALRELTAGIYPRPLVEDGVAAALEALCDRSPIPVVLDVDRARWPQPVEFTAYFLVAEALTNVYRHAQA